MFSHTKSVTRRVLVTKQVNPYVSSPICYLYEIGSPSCSCYKTSKPLCNITHLFPHTKSVTPRVPVTKQVNPYVTWPICSLIRNR